MNFGELFLQFITYLAVDSISALVLLVVIRR